MNDKAVLALTMITLGQVGLCVPLLLARSVRTRAYLPLAVFFAASGLMAAGPAVVAFAPGLEAVFLAGSLPAYLLLGPALWLYVQGLTSETEWRPTPDHGWHLAPAGLGLLATGLMLGLPANVRDRMLLEGELVDRPYPAMVALLVFVLILCWIAQSAAYGVVVFLRLGRYRRRLKDLFASNENRELRWIGWLLIVVGGVWLGAFATLVAENFLGRVLLSREAGATMAMILVWSLALWGLRQKPGFEGRYLEAALDTPLEVAPARKYQRSALGPEQARRIASKIDAVMTQDQLYLDPALSLHGLARRLAISPNHISQTLNETLGMSFFDYVNRWRIQAAKPLIAAGDETILTTALAVGFNARSSFYKAFRIETGQTPNAFRAQAMADARQP